MMSNTAFVASAFTVTWIAFLGYLVHLRRVDRRARAAAEHSIRAGT